LRGILDLYPVSSSDMRTEREAGEISAIIHRLQGSVVELNPTIGSTRSALQAALDEAQSSIQGGNPANAVDRIHTAFHAYLKAVWDELMWKYDPLDDVGKLFRNLVKNHPAFSGQTVRGQDIQKIVRSMSAIVDGLNPIRNKASLAHPNQDLLDKPEAMLYYNTVSTLIQYLNAKLDRE